MTISTAPTDMRIPWVRVADAFMVGCRQGAVNARG
jgi:hypothetical protein